MDMVLAFFADLILFTFGLAVFLFWIVIFAVIAIEIWDTLFENEEDPTPEEVDDVRLP